MSRLMLVLVLGWMLILVACSGSEGNKGSKVDRSKVEPFLLKQEPVKMDVRLDANLNDQIMVLGYDLEPEQLRQGQPYTITFYYKVLAPTKQDMQFFGHLDSEGATPFRMRLDHWVLGHKYPTNKWKPGEIIKDSFRGKVPAGFPSTKGTLWLGFYKGKERLVIKSAGRAKVGKDGRLDAGTIRFDFPKTLNRVYTVYKTKQPITIDGKLDENVWIQTRPAEPFRNVSGSREVTPKTELRMIYDDENLYVSFVCMDEDIWTTYKRRDDPLYKQEVVEIYVDADGNGKTYYELQISPRNMVFDAYFPEVRKDMNLAYDAKMKTAVTVDGTLDNRKDKDKRWIVEAAIPFASIADARNKPPKAREEWKMNFYRMERPKKGGLAASMWSPTLVGDFHTPSRFGTVVFHERLVEEKFKITVEKKTKK